MDRLEASFIANGKAYGLEGPELRDYVEKRLEDAKERDSRAEARGVGKEDETLKTKLTELTAKIQELETNRGETEFRDRLSETRSASRPKPIKIPKYDDKQTIINYLELYEDVATQNQYDDDEWLIRLRVALAGSKYERSCRGCRSYTDAKREILKSYGLTAEKAWRQLMALSQNVEESFHQYVVRVSRAVVLWSMRTVRDGTDDEAETASLDSSIVEHLDKFQEALVKQVTLETSGVELKAFLLERRCFEVALEEFQKTGSSYQDAHGVKSKKQERPKPADMPDYHSTQSFGIAMTEAEEHLSQLPATERRSFCHAQNLCLNCLKPGHWVKICRARPRCTQCNGKHHTLLHVANPPGNGIKTYSCATSSAVHLMTGVAEVRGLKRAKVRVFIDPGSQGSFISSALATAIRPKHVGCDQVTVTAFGTEPAVQQLERVELTLTGASKPIPILAWKKDDMNMSLPTVTTEVVNQWQERGVKLSDQPMDGTPSDVHLLIGADFSNDILLEKTVHNGDVAWKTEIGWVLLGPDRRPAPPSSVVVSCIDTKIERLWQMEQPPSAPTRGPEFPVERIGTQYQVGLLWRSDKRPAENLSQAVAAASSLLKRLKGNGKRQLYDDVLLREYGELGAIEREPNPNEPGYYMPHRAVFRENAATTKTRVVFNASASMRGKDSLNNLLDPGPSLLPDLVGLLLRFREYRFAVQADIRKAFFMIGIREEDRPYLRFVWPKDSGDEMCIWRLTKLPFGANCSPFILNAVLLHHLDGLIENATSEAERTVLALLRDSFYVDDTVVSVPDLGQAEQFKELSVAAMQSAGMELRKWRGNGIASDPEAGEKVLGVPWQSEDDVLAIASIGDHDDSSNSQWSRRHLLHCVASVYDPMGLAAPAVLPGKILLQTSWKLGGTWDQPLPSDVAAKCTQWWGGLSNLPAVKVRRWSGCKPDSNVSLHVFADASEKGYGCGIYLVTDNTSCLLFGKSKVVPPAAPTLARLELQAVCLASRYIKFVVDALRVPVDGIYGWTDSMTTLQWITSPPYRWKTYVANRVTAVQLTAKELGITWNHCPGKMNPADLVSRGTTVDGLTSSEWLHGPQWIINPAAWPAAQTWEPTNKPTPEQRVNAVSIEPTVKWWERLSKWSRVEGVITRILQWRHTSKSRAELKPLAEAALYRVVQRDLFSDEIAAIRDNKPVPVSSKISQLMPFIDEKGVLRAGGRLELSELPYETKHPVILGQHHVTTLLMELAHVQQMHSGVENVLASLRQDVWVLGARRALRSITQRCVVCKRYKSAAATEISPPLPPDRVVHKKPFGLTGIDYAGPIVIRDTDQVRKIWIALFVCGTTRAVHLETVDSLSTEAFLLAYRRFVARRGTPLRIRSDNATTFKAAASKISVVWLFNPPAAPWHGGFFERLVGAVKSPLRKVLGKAFLGPRELDTVLVEVEAVVNRRPLTHVADIADELPLTPAMMISGVWGPDGVKDGDASLTAEQMNSRQRYVNTICKHLHNRWNQEYLTALIAYHQANSSSVAAGDVVLLVDDTRKRQSWRLARVEEVFPGKDGAVRVVRVKVGQASLLRPVQRLVPLEVTPSQEPTNAAAQDVSGEQPESAPEMPETRVTCPQEQPLPAVRTTRRGRAVHPPARLNL